MDGITVASTILSDVDGARGRLIMRGHDVDSLAENRTFEGIAELLWTDLVPGNPREDEIRQRLGTARVNAFRRIHALLTPMDLSANDAPARAVRTALAATESDDAIEVAGLVPVAIANAWRMHEKRSPLPPNTKLGHAEDFLRMLRGDAPSPDQVRALNTYLVTIAEHGMNASTFTARVVASTGATLVGAVTAAYCALQGPLHGGAPGPVLDMLDAIGEEQKIDEWLDEKLTAGERLMGFGHRIYKVRDPRADVLKKAVQTLRRTQDSARLHFAETVEQHALAALARHKPDHALQTNVEFYTALVLEAVGLPRELFTPLFAMGRVVGWIAHVYEQRKTGRLIRPQSEYVGPRPEDDAGAEAAAEAPVDAAAEPN